MSIPSATPRPQAPIRVLTSRWCSRGGRPSDRAPVAIGGAFVDSLRSQLGGRSVGVYAVDYPASREFETSTPAGARDASTHIQAMAANCPNTPPGARRLLAGRGRYRSVHDGDAGRRLPTTSPPRHSSELLGVRSPTRSLQGRCPPSVLCMRRTPSNCACRTIRSALTAGTCVRTPPTSRPEWSSRQRLSPRVGSRSPTRGWLTARRVCEFGYELLRIRLQSTPVPRTASGFA